MWLGGFDSSRLDFCCVAVGVSGFDLGLGVVMNTLTPSRWERIIWLPQVVVLFSCALLVALG
jgi:hypothetical protein